ncbi:phage-related lysozyme [Candidatus Liberibacter africanus PTSAPSY]|uniref:Lysozyme n=2 Tax=Liberibacter africanus TaxID=34020 RepID=A0A0G3I3X2_LIBAF|nr:phage-related lysozyme [Candidatus Liberibacter africanus PTSAPSY]
MNGDETNETNETNGTNEVLIPGLLVDMVERYEGVRVTAYKDPGRGVWTIGYGHTGPDVHEGMTITQEQAEELLKGDLRKHVDLLLSASPIMASVSENRLAAVGDFVFNLGIGNYRKSTFKKCIDAEDWENAATECKKWIHGGGKVLPGLVKRRNEEAALLISG